MSVIPMSPQQPLQKNAVMSCLKKLSREQLILLLILSIVAALLVTFVVAPLWAMLRSSVLDSDGAFVGLANFSDYFASHAVWYSLTNTFTLGITVMLAGSVNAL